MVMVYEEKPVFFDRPDAGRRLAEKLRHYEGSQVTVFAVPHGGVPKNVEPSSGGKTW